MKLPKIYQICHILIKLKYLFYMISKLITVGTTLFVIDQPACFKRPTVKLTHPPGLPAYQPSILNAQLNLKATLKNKLITNLFRSILVFKLSTCPQKLTMTSSLWKEYLQSQKPLRNPKILAGAIYARKCFLMPRIWKNINTRFIFR